MKSNSPFARKAQGIQLHVTSLLVALAAGENVLQ